MRIASLAAAALLAASTLQASAAGLFEKNFWLSGPNYDGVLPRCDSESVGGNIASAFAGKESGYWNSPATIQKFDRVHEIGFQPWGPSFIPRRFCEARALLSDGKYHEVSYAIAEDTGWLGTGWGVRWCVAGYDRDLTSAPNCKMARP